MVLSSMKLFQFWIFVCCLGRYVDCVHDSLEIPLVELRKDHKTNTHVERGRFHLIGGLSNRTNRSKVSLQEFQSALQCAPFEPGLEISNGYQLVKAAPMTRASIENICAWVETECDPWAACHAKVTELKQSKGGLVEEQKYTSSGGQFQVKLFRIMNGQLYMDWPWGRDRFQRSYRSVTELFSLLTSMISDLPDTVFFTGLERFVFPFNFPVVGFSSSPSMMSADIPIPWFKPFAQEMRAYLKHELSRSERVSSEASLSDNYIHGQDEWDIVLKWDEKLPKAAFYGSLSGVRQIFFDVAATRPDLFDIGWTGDYAYVHGKPWNPESNETTCDGCEQYSTTLDPVNNKTGYLGHLYDKHLSQGVEFHPGKYKYLVVLTGLDGLATADRLSMYLAHSGAVILLQESPFIYHFSPRLKPWVHYVPLSYSAADVIDKVEWLQEHDEAASSIARNAKVFGKSFLRLEDTFCYLATALQAIGKLQNGTSVLQPFDPVLYSFEE